MKINRRNFIANSLATAGAYASIPGLSKGVEETTFKKKIFHSGELDFKISIFSKHLQWLDYKAMASTAAELGFDGIDLTVRPGGHVLPERVTEDLPKAFEAVKNAGLEMFSIVTAIEHAEDPSTEKILETASTLGISYYRLNWYHYDDGKSIEDNLNQIASNIKKLESLNKKYKIRGVYQNHSGKYFGAPVWDLAQVLKNVNAEWTGSQYDIYHATIEGANSWIYGLKLISPYIKMITIKDFEWRKKQGKWIPESIPLGEGMIDFKNYFSTLKNLNIRCPVSLHYEYPLGGADQGARTLTMEKQAVLDLMKKDLMYLKQSLRESGLLK